MRGRFRNLHTLSLDCRATRLSMAASALLGACDMVSVIVRHTMVQLATSDTRAYSSPRDAGGPSASENCPQPMKSEISNSLASISQPGLRVRLLHQLLHVHAIDRGSCLRGRSGSKSAGYPAKTAARTKSGWLALCSHSVNSRRVTRSRSNTVGDDGLRSRPRIPSYRG